MNYEFVIKGNFIHWFSVKAKRVTKSVLAPKILAMSSCIDIAHVMLSTLQKIKTQIKIARIPVVVCIDSYSLYEYILKLGSTKEKRLIIDIMTL